MADDIAIRAVIEGWLQAVGRKDAAAALAPFSDDIVEFNLAPPLKARHPSAAGYQAWFDTWRGPLRFEIRDLAVTAGDSVAFAHALVRMLGTKTDGEENDMWFRETIGLRKNGDTWRITHIHDSVPFYMDGSDRAALDLKPRG